MIPTEIIYLRTPTHSNFLPTEGVTVGDKKRTPQAETFFAIRDYFSTHPIFSALIFKICQWVGLVQLVFYSFFLSLIAS